VRALVADAVEQGADRTLTLIDDLEIVPPEIPGAFGQVARRRSPRWRTRSPAASTRARTVGRTIDDVYARAGRRAALRAVLGADNSPQAAKRQLVRDLLKDRNVAP
jgi:hypothetical protein